MTLRTLNFRRKKDDILGITRFSLYYVAVDDYIDQDRLSSSPHMFGLLAAHNRFETTSAPARSMATPSIEYEYSY